MIETEVIRVDPERPDPEVMRRAGELIRAGELVAFPTETVYGLGGDALNPGASEKIYAAKRRPSDNPLIVHIADMEHLDRIIRELPPEGEKLARAFWPGPLTIGAPDDDLSQDGCSAAYDQRRTQYGCGPHAGA